MSGLYLPTEDEFDPSTDDFIFPFLAKERKYKHFDLPLSKAELNQSIDFGLDVNPHRFLPLLGFTDVVRRYVRSPSGSREIKVKTRDIRFAGHSDAAFLQGYAAHLHSYYEKALTVDATSSSVLAYRPDGGTNIHHAKALFDEIRSRMNCTVFAIDISGFFDCLDHITLRDHVAGLLGVARLEGHHANVWKNLTRYSWVETADLDKLLGKRRNGQGRICSPSDFAKHVRGRKDGLVRTHSLSFGIPQGTPVSGLYANIYMRSFDREMRAFCQQAGGSYRRYSDDIAIVMPPGSILCDVVSIVEKMLADFGLTISANKTEIAIFENGKLISEKPIQYLGFTFDGINTLIRASSMDAYRRKMRAGINAKLVAAKVKKIPPSEVYRRECLSRYTHLGKRRNFLRYAYKASDLMGSPEIRQQVKAHTTWFNRAWKSQVSKVFG